jgi:protein-S-isoprenylcysteine O-methyltransferase Ste14
MITIVKRLISVCLVSVQFICLGIYLATGPFIAHTLLTVIFELFSIFIGLWAIHAMSNSRLNIFPDIRPGAVIITTGPYKYVRHPMYLAVILFTASLLADHFTCFRLIIFIVLLTDLLFKIEYEEKKLNEAFSDYRQYRKHSGKLIPFIY